MFYFLLLLRPSTWLVSSLCATFDLPSSLICAADDAPRRHTDEPCSFSDIYYCHIRSYLYMYNACLMQTRSARWVRADCHALRASALSWITTLIVCYSLLDGESHARVQVMAFSKRRAAAATCAMYPICHRRLYLLCFFTYTACEAAAAQSLLVFYFFYIYSVIVRR